MTQIAPPPLPYSLIHDHRYTSGFLPPSAMTTSAPVTASGGEWWKHLSLRGRHEITGIIHNWQARRTKCIEEGLPPSSPEESSEDDNPTVSSHPCRSPSSPWNRRRRTSTASWWRWSQRRRWCQCSGRCRRSSATTCSSSSTTNWRRSKSSGSRRVSRLKRPWSPRIRDLSMSNGHCTSLCTEPVTSPASGGSSASKRRSVTACFMRFHWRRKWRQHMQSWTRTLSSSAAP